MEKKSVLFINQHYYPEYVSAGQHLTDLAEYLADKGFDVSVLCGRGGYTGESNASPKREKHNGVNIRRLSTTDFGRSSKIGRVVDYFTFYIQATLYCFCSGEYDIIVTLTTPPLINFLGALVNKIKGQKYGVWAMDLHPDAEEELGMIEKDGILSRILHFVNDVGYRNAIFVVSLGKYMGDTIKKKGVISSKIHEIPVWNKKEEVYPIPDNENSLINDLSLSDNFVVMYSGNAGMFHRFSEVLEVMSRLNGHDDIYFLFVGEGPRKRNIKSYVNKHNIVNFEYLSYFPRNKIKYSLSIADVHLITLRNEISGIAFPSKIYGIMGVGRPAIMVGPDRSGPSKLIKENKIGVVIDTKNELEDLDMNAANRLEEEILDMYNNKGRVSEIGNRAREVFLDKYERDVACERWRELLLSIDS